MIEIIFEFLTGLLDETVRKRKAIGYKAIFIAFFLSFLLYAILHDAVSGTFSFKPSFLALAIGVTFAAFCTATIYAYRKMKERK